MTLNRVAVVEPFVDQVYKGLLSAISHGELQPGQRIPQAEVAASFGVSRQPVSHALHLLKQQGLIEAWGKKGFAVSEVQIDLVRDLYQIRGQLDGLAARLAATRVQQGAVSATEIELARHAVKSAGNLDNTASIRQILEAEMIFHKAIYNMSGNPSIEQTLSNHWPHLMRAMALIHSRRQTTREAHSEHDGILSAIAEGNAAAAESLAMAHTARASVEMARHLQTRKPAA